MSCNRDGRQCQRAGDAVGGGDTELVQMTGRRSGGNCPTCGQFLPADVGTHTCPTVSTESPTIEAALNQAIANDERRPFIVVDGMDKYFPLTGGPSHEIQVAELRRITRDGGVAALYHYDKNSHPANDPRRPVAIFNDGRPAMVTAEVRSAVDQVDWRTNSEAIHAIMDGLDKLEEIPTAGGPMPEVFDRLGWGSSLDMQQALSVTRDTVTERIDEGVGFTYKDAQPLWGAHLTELDRRIEAQAGPALEKIRNELGQDFWEEGYTEDEVNDGCFKLNEVARNVFGLPGEVAVMWNHNDPWSGFGGDSELVYIKEVPGDIDRPELPGTVETWSLSSPFLADSDPNDFINDLRRIARREAAPDAVYPAEEVFYDNYNWGPWRDEEATWVDADEKSGEGETDE